MSSLFLLAGEPSGDIHGAALAAALRCELPDLSLCGVAGPAMRKEGVLPKLDIEELAVMGISDVLKNLPSLYSHYRNLSREIVKESPDAVVLIDYQEFNMRMARKLRREGYKGKIIQYISPSVWAWRPGRAQFLSRYADLLLTIYPFEESYYKGTSLPVRYIGNPVVHEALPHRQEEKELSTIALFPGSRKSEVRLNLPLQLAAAEKLQMRNPALDFRLSVASERLLPEIEPLAARSSLRSLSLIPPEGKYELMAKSGAAIATSGTVNLELAILGCPTAVTYILTPLNRFVAEYLLRLCLPHYCIVNIIAGEELFPEWIERKPNPASIAAQVEELLEGKLRDRCLAGCRRCGELLATPHSPANHAAQAIAELLR